MLTVTVGESSMAMGHYLDLDGSVPANVTDDLNGDDDQIERSAGFGRQRS